MDCFLLWGLQDEGGEFPGAAWHLKVSATLCADGIGPFVLVITVSRPLGGAGQRPSPRAPRSPALYQPREAGRQGGRRLWCSPCRTRKWNLSNAKGHALPPRVVFPSPEAWPHTESHRAWQGDQLYRPSGHCPLDEMPCPLQRRWRWEFGAAGSICLTRTGERDPRGPWAGSELLRQLCSATQEELGLPHPGGLPPSQILGGKEHTWPCMGTGAVYKGGLSARLDSRHQLCCQLRREGTADCVPAP